MSQRSNKKRPATPPPPKSTAPARSGNVTIASAHAEKPAPPPATTTTGPMGLPLWMWVMLAVGAVGYASRFAGAPSGLVFALAAAGLIPLAGLIGRSTEDLAVYVGPKWGGLLNATFGNAAELIIAGVALQAGLFGLVKASITGSIIGNILLVLGASLVVGGRRHGIQRFDAGEAGRNATLLFMALIGLVLPAAFNYSAPGELIIIEEVSVMVSVILLILYAAYIVYSLTATQDDAIQHELHAADPTEHTPWSRQTALIVLALATLATVLLSEALVATVEEVTHTLGISEFFVGVIIVPLVGNVAEHFSAITLAGKNQMDISLGIAAGSSTQVALLVAPILVLLGLLFWNLGQIPEPLTLVFTPMEIIAVAASAMVFNYISHDGETNWLEGVVLLGLYIMLAAIFFLLPFSEAAATAH
jgi:Ca2+:H+ antiporter